MEIDSKEVMGVDACSTDNLTKLRELVEEMDNHHHKSDEYYQLIKDVEDVIKNEKILISRLNKSENKLERYENICATILTIISAAKI